MCLSPTVCAGTKNGLSFTESSVQHYNGMKARYEGCEIITGNLEITLMVQDFDFSFLGVSTLFITGCNALHCFDGRDCFLNLSRLQDFNYHNCTT